MASVRVLPVNAVSRYLIPFLSHHHGHGSVLYAGIHGAPEYLLYLPGQGAGGDIPVPRLPAQKHIPDASAHHIRLVSMFVQSIYNLLCRSRNSDFHVCLLPHTLNIL